jgi:nucleotidyltransferase substrate binding protein (TIGR01987 family)
MDERTPRWEQRLNNFTKALMRLKDAVDLGKERPLSDLEKQGLIQAFEFTHELAWKTLKDLLVSRGNSEIYGSKDASRLAFQLGLINHGEIWMDMIKSRNLTSHTYDEQTAEKMVSAVCGHYIHAFIELEERLNQLKDDE